MSRIAERYSTAIMSGNLLSEFRTSFSDADVLGAYGFAGKENPLGVALARLLSGGKAASAKDALATMAMDRAKIDGRRISAAYAGLIVDEVLAWYFFGTCQYCQGHGHPVIPNTTTLSDEPCAHCNGRGKVDLLESIPQKRHGLASWLSYMIDVSLSGVGGAAVRKLLDPAEQ